MRRRSVRITLRDEVLYALEVQAQAQRRSLSSTIELYVTSDVGLAPEIRPGSGIGPEEASAGIELAPSVRVLHGPQLAPPPSPLARTRPVPGRERPPRNAMCPHQIPVNGHCRVCDR
jgi:hypothetical protein